MSNNSSKIKAFGSFMYLFIMFILSVVFYSIGYFVGIMWHVFKSMFGVELVRSNEKQTKTKYDEWLN